MLELDRWVAVVKKILFCVGFQVIALSFLAMFRLLRKIYEDAAVLVVF